MKKIFLLFLFLPFVSQSQIIFTIAGNGTAGYTGDGSAAILAELNNPCGLAVDTNNNIYISEYYNNTIRKISPSGTITTFAGNGTSGYTGDGLPATAAQLYHPNRIVLDKNENLYVADRYNNVIRKINNRGIITTVAGNGTMGYTGNFGPATNARLYEPTGVAVDKNGNLFIADCFNNVVRKVDTFGIITTFAGTGTAGSTGDGGPASAATLYDPWSLTFDKYGNLFIVDATNNNIRKVDTTGIISNFAGTGVAGFSGDGGQATNASFNDPTAIVFDDSGNAYVPDQLDYHIRKIAVSGIVSSIAGNDTMGFSGDCGPALHAEINNSNELAFDKFGHLLLCDDQNNRVRELGSSISSGITSQPKNDTTTTLSTVNFTITDTVSGNTYQWQQNSGLGFSDLYNAGVYSGVNTPTLTITSVPMSLNNDLYRCIVSSAAGCNDSTSNALLIIWPLGFNHVVNSMHQICWPNPFNSEIHIYGIPDNEIKLMNSIGQVVIHKFHCNEIKTSELPPGLYFIQVTDNSNGTTELEKVIKE